MYFKLLITVATLFILLASAGCNRSRRIVVQSSTVQHHTTFESNAPDWVRGFIPNSEDRIYFVGRSENRFFGAIQEGRYDGVNTWVHDIDGRYRGQYVTYDGWTSEREAVSSARDDVYDQIRQRLAPRNVGNSSNLIVNNVESGTCTNCNTIIPIFRTDTIVCNDTCSHSSGNCSSSNMVSTGGNNAYYCKDCHTAVASCSGCASIVHAVTQLNRTADHLYSTDIPLNRDINMININIDSLMPSLAAYMTEDELYFEKRTGWFDFKCWMLCSIPAEEFYQIAEDFRDKYELQYSLAQLRSDEDRVRRLVAEDEARTITLERQEEERTWNREDEIVTRAHTIELDKDRHTIPGRRFTVQPE